jgi:asparagine synthase (glutamine-hydrolysing)
MAASLEQRPVLMDHRLVELVLRLPTAVKVRGGSMRWVVEEAARDLLPLEMCHHMAHVPAGSWFGTELRDSARDRLTGVDSWVSQTMDRHAVRDLVERHERDGSEGSRLWALIGLEIWHDRFFGSAPAMPSPRRGSPSIHAPGQVV